MQGLSAGGWDATVRRVRALRPAWGPAGGDAVVDDGAEELLETVVAGRVANRNRSG